MLARSRATRYETDIRGSPRCAAASTPAGSGSGDLNDAAVLLETMAVGYVRLAHDSTITSVNLAGERILGRRAGDLVGHDMWQRLPGARELDFGRVYDAVMETRVAQHSSSAYYPGLATWFDLRIEPVADGGIALYFLDVTARRLAADRLAVLARHSEVLSEISAALTPKSRPRRGGQRRRPGTDGAADAGAVQRGLAAVDEAGRLCDSGSWHLDPDRRAETARLAAAHLDRDALAAGLAMPAALQVPMVARGRTVGLLTVFGDEPYGSEEVALARDVADRSALAIENSASFAPGSHGPGRGGGGRAAARPAG